MSDESNRPTADTRPTPATGTPTPTSGGLSEHSDAMRILAAVDALRTDVKSLERTVASAVTEATAAKTEASAARAEAAVLRGEVATLRSEVDSTRHENRRIEARVVATDEEQRLLKTEFKEFREESRLDKVERNRQREADAQTMSAMTKFVEDATNRNTESVSLATKSSAESSALFTDGIARLDAATAAFAEERAKLDQERTKAAEVERRQNERIDLHERTLGVVQTDVATVVGTQGRIADELGLEPAKPGEAADLDRTRDQKPGRLRALTRQQKIGALLIILVNLTTFAAALFHK